MEEAADIISSPNKAESNSSSNLQNDEYPSSDSDWETISNDEKDADAVYQFKITLKYIKPPIWRRILIVNNSTFAELHDAIIDAMGWFDSHLHVFQARDLEIAPVDEELNLGFMSQLDETKVKLMEFFQKPKDSITYLYDFGDNWLHNIVLENILPYDGKSYPICIAGKRACPPDDCGGVYGYKRLLKILSNPNHPEHQDMKEWMSNMGKDNFDPEAFDPDSACVIM